MNFIQILDEYGIKHVSAGEHHHVSGDFVGIDCPFCGDDGDYHLGYNPNGDFCTCWKSGYHSKAEVLHALTGEPWNKIKELLGSLDCDPRSEVKTNGKLKIPEGVGPLLRCHRKYLKGRGFDPDQLEKLWGIKGIGPAPRFQFRLFIPIFFQGQMMSWTTRSTNDQSAKRYSGASKHEEAIPAKKLLMGEDYCRHSIIATEGPFDVFRIGPGAVATLGTGFSRRQLLRMSKYPLRVVVFDNEPEAQVRANKLCDALECFPGTTKNVQLSSKDPGEASEKEVKLLRKFLR